MNITRRWFLVGSAATLAVAQTKLILPEAIAKPTLIPLQDYTSIRKMYELLIMPNGTTDQRMAVSVTRTNSTQPLIYYEINARSFFRWTGYPSPITFLPNQTWDINIEPNTTNNFMIEIYYENNQKHYAELFRWNQGILVEKTVYRLPA